MTKARRNTVVSSAGKGHCIKWIATTIFVSLKWQIRKLHPQNSLFLSNTHTAQLILWHGHGHGTFRVRRRGKGTQSKRNGRTKEAEFFLGGGGIRILKNMSNSDFWTCTHSGQWCLRLLSLIVIVLRGDLKNKTAEDRHDCIGFLPPKQMKRKHVLGGFHSTFQWGGKNIARQPTSMTKLTRFYRFPVLMEHQKD